MDNFNIELDDITQDTFDLDIDLGEDTKIIPEIRAMRPEEHRYMRPLTEEERAQAVVDLMYKERGEEAPSGLRLLRTVESPEAKAVTEFALLPHWTALKAVRGIIGAVEPNVSIKDMLVDSAAKGIFEPEKVEPAGVSILKAYPKTDWRIAGVVGALAEIGVLAPGLIRLMGNIASSPIKGLTKDAQYTQVLNAAKKTPAWNKTVQGISRSKNIPVEEVDRQLTTKLWDIRNKANYFKVVNANLKRMTGVDILSEAGFAKTIRPKLKAGDMVKFGEQTGKVLEIKGNRATLDVLGKQITAKLSELQPTEGKVVKAETGQYAENEANLLYHGTGKESAQDILKSGFKTGEELSKGEKTGLISLGTKERAFHYSRGEKVGVQLPVSIKGLNLLEVKAGELYPNNLEKYTKLMNEGNYDGIRVIDDVYTGSGKTAEVLLKKEIATQQLSTPTGEGQKPAEGRLPQEPIKPEALIRRETEMGKRLDIVEQAKDRLQELSTVREAFKGRITKYKDAYLKEELTGIPRYYITKEGGIKPDEALEELRNNYGIDLRDEVELKEYLRGLEAEKKNLESEIAYEKPKFLRKKETTLLKDQIKVAELVTKKALRLGEVIGRKEQQLHAKDIEQRATARKEAVTLINRIKQIDTSRMSPPYKGAIDNIKEAIDFAVPTKKTLASLQATRDFIEKNPDRELPDYVYEDIKRLEKKNRSNMTLGELRSLNDYLNHLATLNRLKNKIRVGQQLREQEEVVQISIQEIQPIKPTEPIRITDQPKRFKQIRENLKTIKNIFGIEQEHYDLIVETLAGKNSVTYDVLMNQIKQGRLAELRYKQTISDNWQRDLEAIDFQNEHNIKNINKWYNEIVKTGKFELTRGTRMALYRHSLNEDNLRHILEGGIAFKDDPTKIYKISEEDFTKILENLTEAEKAYAGLPVSRLFRRQGEELAKVFLLKNGYELKLITDNTYYPIRIAKAGMPVELEQESILDDLKDRYIRVGLSKGMLNERVKSKLPLIVGDLYSDMISSTSRAAAYVGLEIPMSNASRLLYDTRFKSTVAMKYGYEYWKEIEEGLRDMAGQFKNYSAFEQGILGLKNQLSKAILGLNPFVIMKQPVSYLLYSIYVRPQYLAKAALMKPSELSQAIERLKQNSPEFWARVEQGFQRDIAEVFLGKKVGEKFFVGGKALTEKQLSGIMWADKMTVARGMQACIDQKLDELKESNLSVEEKLNQAYRFAEQVTNKTQPTFAIEHRSPMSRGNPVEKMLTFASTQTNQHLNIIRRTWRQYKRTKSPEDFKRFLYATFLISVVSAGTVAGIDELRKAIYKTKSSLGNFFISMAGNNLAMLYIARDLWYSLRSKVERGTFAGSDVNVTVTSFANNMVDMFSHAIRVFTVKKADTKRKEMLKFLEKVAEVTTEASGIALFNAPYRLMRGIFKIPKPKGDSGLGLDIDLDIDLGDIDLGDIDLGGIEF